jgi:putative endonuclease
MIRGALPALLADVEKSTLHRGLEFETAACRYLEQTRFNLRVLARNYRWRGGEIDIVLEENRELVFVEVRARAHGAMVDGIASVGFRKQLRLRRTIEFYLANYRGKAKTARVDILAWDGRKWTEARNIQLAGGW